MLRGILEFCQALKQTGSSLTYSISPECKQQYQPNREATGLIHCPNPRANKTSKRENCHDDVTGSSQRLYPSKEKRVKFPDTTERDRWFKGNILQADILGVFTQETCVLVLAK